MVHEDKRIQPNFDVQRVLSNIPKSSKAVKLMTFSPKTNDVSKERGSLL